MAQLANRKSGFEEALSGGVDDENAGIIGVKTDGNHGNGLGGVRRS